MKLLRCPTAWSTRGTQGVCCSSADAASRWSLPAPQPSAASVAQTTRGWFEKSSMAGVRRTRPYIRGATLETARVTGYLFEGTLVLNLGHYPHYLPGFLSGLQLFGFKLGYLGNKMVLELYLE